MNVKEALPDTFELPCTSILDQEQARHQSLVGVAVNTAPPSRLGDAVEVGRRPLSRGPKLSDFAMIEPSDVSAAGRTSRYGSGPARNELQGGGLG